MMKREMMDTGSDLAAAQRMRQWRGELHDSFRERSVSPQGKKKKLRAGHEIENVLEQANVLKRELIEQKRGQQQQQREEEEALLSAKRHQRPLQLPEVRLSKQDLGLQEGGVRSGCATPMPLQRVVVHERVSGNATGGCGTPLPAHNVSLSGTLVLNLSGSYLKKTTSQAEKVYDPDLSRVYSACTRHMLKDRDSRFYQDYRGRTLYYIQHMNPTQSCSHVENVTVSVLLRGLDVDAVCSVCGCAGDISMCLHCCRAYCTQGQHGIAHHCHPLSVSLDDLAFRCHCCAADMPHDAAPFTGIAKTLRMQQSLRRHRLHAACSTLGTQQYISWGSPLDLPSAADFGTTSSIPDDESSSAESQPEEAPPGGSSDEASESVATTEGYESIEFLEVVLGVCQEDMGALAAQPPVAEEDCCTAERQGVTLGKLDALAAAAQPQQRGSVAECCFCGMEVALEAGAAPKMRCPGCRRVSCSRHAVEWHHGMSCAGYDSVQKWRKTAGVNRASRARKPRA